MVLDSFLPGHKNEDHSCLSTRGSHSSEMPSRAGQVQPSRSPPLRSSNGRSKSRPSARPENLWSLGGSKRDALPKLDDGTTSLRKNRVVSVWAVRAQKGALIAGLHSVTSSHSSCSNRAGSVESARLAGIAAEISPISPIVSTADMITHGSEAVA